MSVRPGETVALDLFVNSSTGQKVTDYLHVQNALGRTVTIAGPAIDFRPEDAVMELSSPRVKVDGKLLTSSQGSISGNAIWVDLPGYGRFVFSLVKRPDLSMVRAGELRGTSVKWNSAGHEFLVETDKPVIPGDKAFHLYLFHIRRDVSVFGMSAGPRPDDPIISR